MNQQPETNGNAKATPDTAAEALSQPSMVARLGRLCLKELREILRDRRTIVTLVLMPLLVYPLMYMMFNRFLTTTLQTEKPQIEVYIGVESRLAGEALHSHLSKGEAILHARGDFATGPANEAKPRLASSEALPKHEIRVFEQNLRARVAEGSIDIGMIVLPPKERIRQPRQPGQPRQEQEFECELIYRKDSPLSEASMRYIEDRLNALNEQFIREFMAFPAVQQALPQFGIRAELPTRVVRTSIRQAGTSSSLTTIKTIVPLILILMTITGAVYPAIDLTAGERERGTMEMLMSAPVPRLGLLIAKYVAVLTVALFTATANLVAMTVTLMATDLGPKLFGAEGLSPLLVSQVFALMILFAAFFSAILLALTSFARSFKEAQAYLIPVMLLALAPGIMSLMPELKFNGILAITPLVNVVLLARDILELNVDPLLASAAVVSTILYAIAALALAAKVFGSDAILYGSEGTWSDLWRRPTHSRPAATMAAAMSCLALLFPANFLVSNSLRGFSEVSMALWLVLAAVSLVVLFVGVPMLFANAQKIRIRDGFQLWPAAIFAFGGAVILGVSIWPFSHEIILFQNVLGISSLGEAQIKAAQEVIERLRQVPLVVLLLTLAVTPAVCEEFFFRGYLFRALRETMRPWKTIVVSAMLFGAFHVVTTNALSVERFLPSTIMGLVLGWVCWRSKSVLPGMLLHACHNGLLLTILYYRDELAARNWGIQEESHMPATWLATAAVVVVVGVALVWLVTKNNENATPEDDHQTSRVE